MQLACQFSDLQTPAFLVDREKFDRNCERMLKLKQDFGCSLRCHTKTHKTVEGATIQTGGSKRCIVVSTVAEAEFYAEAGFDDILYGYPLTPDKFDRCFDLHEKLQKFHVMTDSQLIAGLLQKFKPDLKKPWSVFMKIDCGNNRAGVWHEDIDCAVELVNSINGCKNTRFAGVYVHCGNSYHAKEESLAVGQVAESAVSLTLKFVENMEKRGIKCPVFGTGSTPSLSQHPDVMKRLTEIHAGNYVFFDAQQFSLGSCTMDEIACQVATRVIGHYPRRNELLVDCGFLGLSKQGLGSIAGNPGFALFKDHPELALIEMTQEHGKVTSLDGKLNYEKYPIGSMLFLYPWHSCATAAMYPRYYIHKDGLVTETWIPNRGW